ncbi:hypothetical protein K9L67_04455 [Candidatus Woesearchaeota archaeon]|nr:hypothetical protein [Candidatus Woesearchaeota archaeon]MCF7901451.1 hypothetical protein [Candidatus Woesearchaeota archaeon]MCF8013536.1 hypothetical protein [Candidatus Woesearchaeota archaeon]
MQNKKAQAAIEFLTTYGWAFMVFVGVIGYISYSFINPTTLIPDSCSFTEGLICRDMQITTNEIKLSLESGEGGDIAVSKIICDYEGVEAENDVAVDILSGSAAELSCDFADGTFRSGEKVKFGVQIIYTAPSIGQQLPKLVGTQMTGTVV